MNALTVRTYCAAAVLAGSLQATSAFAAPDVTVVNSPSHPIPVTGGVAVTNTVPVTGTVNIGSLPAVTGTVNIGTMPPIAVTANVADSANSAFAVWGNAGFSSPLTMYFTIPPSKRFVVENINMACQVPTGSQIYTSALRYGYYASPPAGSPTFLLMNLPLQTLSVNVNGYDYYTANVSTRVYADPGANRVADLSLAVEGTAGASCNGMLSGYLVPLP